MLVGRLAWCGNSENCCPPASKGMIAVGTAARNSKNVWQPGAVCEVSLEMRMSIVNAAIAIPV
jgi:hypothetical protein